MAICRKDVDARRFRDVTEPEPEGSAALQSDNASGANVIRRIRMLRLAQVIEMTGLGKTKIYELQADGSFPPRVQITGHSVGWVESEVQDWLATRVALSRARSSAGLPG